MPKPKISRKVRKIQIHYPVLGVASVHFYWSDGGNSNSQGTGTAEWISSIAEYSGMVKHVSELFGMTVTRYAWNVEELDIPQVIEAIEA